MIRLLGHLNPQIKLKDFIYNDVYTISFSRFNEATLAAEKQDLLVKQLTVQQKRTAYIYDRYFAHYIGKAEESRYESFKRA